MPARRGDPVRNTAIAGTKRCPRQPSAGSEFRADAVSGGAAKRSIDWLDCLHLAHSFRRVTVDPRKSPEMQGPRPALAGPRIVQ